MPTILRAQADSASTEGKNSNMEIKRIGSQPSNKGPHIVKLYPGRSQQQKTRLAKEIVKDVVAIAKCEEKSVSVAIEEIKPEDWAEKVYRPDILNSPEKLYKEPG
jgi:4-oxalocrotonate tautomerase